MKKFFALAAATFALVALPPVLTAQENDGARFKGLAVEAHFANLYAAGGLSDHLLCVAGAGLGVEWTLPLNFDRFDLGASLRLDWSQYVPKSGGKLDSGFDIFALPGIFVRVPFKLGNLDFAFQPALSYGLAFKCPKGRSGLKGFYVDQSICVAAGLRFVLPKTPLEVELAPLFAAQFENSDVLFEAGFRLGAAWHFGKKNGGKK